jgi:hypothetical protein
MALERIDVHAHVVPPVWHAAVKQGGKKPIPPVRLVI